MNMLPVNASLDLGDMAITNSVELTKHFLSDNTPEANYRKYIRRFKLALMVILSIWKTSLACRVFRVVAWCSKKKMVRVDTQTVISSWAIMAYEKTLRNWAVPQYPGKLMGSDPFPINDDFTVPSTGEGSSPNPAPILFLFNSIPKLLFVPMLASKTFEAAKPPVSISHIPFSCKKLFPARFTHLLNKSAYGIHSNAK